MLTELHVLMLHVVPRYRLQHLILDVVCSVLVKDDWRGRVKIRGVSN